MSKKIPAKSKKRAPRGTFDRKLYQRDYMRKRRARERPIEVSITIGGVSA